MKKTTKKSNKNNAFYGLYLIGCVLVVSFIAILILTGGRGDKTPSITAEATLRYSSEQIPAVITDDQGELIEDTSIPTIDEVDGGQFEDIDTGVSVNEGEYEDLGWSEYFNTSSPEAFKNDTLNKCIYANNKYGAQCVSLARVFWWSYADRDVSTCGTGMAKGMMKCADANAGDDFIVINYNDISSIQAGDWLVFGGGTFGHIGMALAPVVNGYVTLLGENQGGSYCDRGGAATNIINKSVKDLIGGYRPKAYIKEEPTPEPEPEPSDTCKVRNVKKGDTLGTIMKECRGEIEWGNAMDEYASHWYSTKFKLHLTVYDGWNSKNGVGLYAGDVIEYR